MMAWRCSADSNEEMVKNFKSHSTITTKAVENAFLNVPRAAFLPEDLQDEAYSDSPIRGDDHLHMSAPHMYATVLEALELKPGMSFLNIGSGTGYFSMLAGYIIGSKGLNHGVELRANLVEHANECCDEFLMYTPKMRKVICYPQFIAGNCFHIDALAQKYDRVYCGAACPRQKTSFFLQLLKPGGFVIVPSNSKLMKFVCVSSSCVSDNVIMNDVCFESLVLPDNDEQSPKLRFAGLKVKTKKIKVYPPPGLLISKTSARKSLARLRALQDVVGCLSESRCIPRAFAYVPSFHQIHQLTEKSKSKGKVQQQHPIDQTIDFFPLKTAEKKESGLSVIGSKANEETAEFWSDLQNDCIWESVVDFTYSLCSNVEGLQETCLQVYAKVKQKKSKKLATPEISGLHSSESDLCDSHLQKKIPENCQNLWKSHLFSDRKRDSTKHNHQNADGYSQTSVERPGGSDGVDNSSQSRERKPGKKVGTCLQFTNKKLLMRSGDHNGHSGISVESLTEHDNSTNLSDKASGRAKKFFQDTEEKLNESEKLEGSQESVKSCSSTLETGSQKGKRRGADSDRQNCKETETQSKSSGSVSGQQLCPIQTDECFMDKLAKTPGPSWMNDEDIQLVQLLINSLGSGTSKMNGKCLSKHIIVLPSLFSPSVLVRYPKISSYSPESLTFRALALLRVVHVIDCVIPFLCSTSPTIESVTKPKSDRPYPLTSFTDSSFGSLNTPLLHSSSDSIFNDEADMFITSGIENIYKRKDCIQQKLDLHKCLQSQFKEQHALLKKQIQLIEEQSVMLQRVESQARALSVRELERLHQTQQRVNEQKSKRHELVGKQLELAKERQQNDHEVAQLKLQMEILHSEEVKFVQLVEKKKKLKKMLKDAEERLKKVQVQPNVSLVTDSPIGPEDSKYRYNASSILSSLRFLLPLSHRRMGIIAELLRATEQPLPDQTPVVYIDRRISLAERLSCPRKSVFYQIFEELKGENMSFRWSKRKCDQWWEVKFVGEGIIDQGGGFRDSLAELSDELCPQGSDITQILPLFVRSVNQRDQVGEYRDCFVPNPSFKNMKMFFWLGKLMGAAYRSDESLTLSFPPFVWKLLAGEHVTWCTDFAGVDEASVNLISNIEAVSEEEFSEIYAAELDFTTAFSDGTVVEVKEGGNQIQVNYEDCVEYCKLVKKTRMMESITQVKAMRDGLLSVIPQSLLELITFQELERGVCGYNEISLSQLKESVHYGDELSADSECVLQLWKVLESFTTEDRSRFLRFVTGRKRLPARITLSQMCGEKDTLPSASTCASTLMLPSYSSVQVAEKKMRYAIYNCVAIDTDTSPW